MMTTEHRIGFTPLPTGGRPVSHVETFTGGFPVTGCQDCTTLAEQSGAKGYYFGSIAHHMRTEHAVTVTEPEPEPEPQEIQPWGGKHAEIRRQALERGERA